MVMHDTPVQGVPLQHLGTEMPLEEPPARLVREYTVPFVMRLAAALATVLPTTRTVYSPIIMAAQRLPRRGDVM